MSNDHNNEIAQTRRMSYRNANTGRTDRSRHLLSSNGPYQEYSNRMAGLIPGVDKGDPRNRFNPTESRSASVTMLNLKENSQPYRREFRGIGGLLEHLERRLQAPKPDGTSPPERRIYMLEGLNADVISIIGGFFHIDPLFFVNQEQVSIWDKSHFGARMTECLPSATSSMSHFCLPYFEMMHFNDPITDFQVNCKLTGRHVAVTRFDRVFLHEAAVRRKCSYWDRYNDDKGWDVIILTDPPVVEVTQRRQTGVMSNAPFQGGYIDFIPRNSTMKEIPSGPPRTSMRNDLVYYWATHQSLFPQLSSPTVAKLFLRKIVASHYMQLLFWTRSMISNQEWHLSRHSNLAVMPIEFVEEQWSDLQATNRRCIEYTEDVERILLTLGGGARAADFGFSDDAAWMDSNKDFELIYERLKRLKARYEVLLSSITGLAGILGNRQSISEAKRSFREGKNVKVLTLVGMVFIPLAFICGIFSMNENFLPGSSEFWVYWVTAVPLIVVVFSASMVANRGYDDDAGTWNVTNMWRRTRGRDV